MKFEKGFSAAYPLSRYWVWKFIETLVLTLLLIFVACLVRAKDPFSLWGPIPWLLLIPIFCSLYFGAVYGVLSLALILLALVYYQPITDSTHWSIQIYVFGGLCFTLLAGVFSSYWKARIAHVEHLNRYVREHLEDLSRDYYLLRISHERIEQAYIVKPISLRDAFFQIQQDAAEANHEITQRNAERLLGLFGQYCSINNAALCLLSPKGNIKALAFMGGVFDIKPEDALLQHVLQNNETSYLAVNRLSEKEFSAYKAVIPLVNVQRKLIGFVIIKDIPFWSLTHDNLEVLSVFAAYFVKQCTVFGNKKLKEFPDCPMPFLKEMTDLVALKKESRVDSALSCLVIPTGPQQEKIVFILEQQKRSLDYLWVRRHDQTVLMITLLPLSGLLSLMGHKNRLAKLLKNEFGLEMNQQGYNFRYQLLTGEPVAQQLDAFVKEAEHAIT